MKIASRTRTPSDVKAIRPSRTRTASVRKPSKSSRAVRSLFIVLEGGEGSGKSTALRKLKEILGDKIVTTREPGGTEYAELIRTTAIKHPLAKGASPHTTMCLMFAARFDNLFRLIAPALIPQAGKTGGRKGLANKPVLADRLDGSSFAYNVEAQSNGELEEVFWSMRKLFPVHPDLYVFFDVDPKEGMRRAQARNGHADAVNGTKSYDHFDDRKLQFHTRVRKGYLKFLKRVPHVIIDANRPQDVVIDEFIKLVRSKTRL